MDDQHDLMNLMRDIGEKLSVGAVARYSLRFSVNGLIHMYMLSKCFVQCVAALSGFQTI